MREPAGRLSPAHSLTAAGLLLLAACAGAPAGRMPADADPAIAVQQQAETEQRMCAAAGCRHDVTIRLQRRDGSRYERSFATFPPSVMGGNVMIVPGETLHIEAEVEGDRLIGLQIVETVRHPERTVTARFVQQDDGSMLLHLQNPFDRPLKFHMALMPLSTDRLFRSSSCPVIAGGSAYEHWPFPVFQLLLLEPRLLAESAETVCEY